MTDRTFSRQAGDKYPGECRRFYEFRYDGDRGVSGVAMRYGDTATFPWGLKERFEPGAFTNLGSEDILLNLQHQRSKPLARTGGGGLQLLDSPTELRLEANLPEGLTDAEDALVLVRERILRGFSVEFVPEEWRELKPDNMVVIQRAKLTGISLVDRPQYTKSKVDRRAAVDEDRIRELIEEHRSKDEGDLDTAALAKGIASGVAETVKDEVREQVEAAMQARDDAEEARQQAEADAAAAEQRAADEAANTEESAHERAELIVMLQPLLTDGVELRGKSNHEIMVLAAGNEIKDAADQSEDYLRAKLEGILERRQEAGPSASVSKPNPSTVRSGKVSIHRIVEQKRSKARRS